MATKAAPTAGQLHRLTARQVLAAEAGDLNDGGGLVLRIGPARAAWVWRYTSPTGARREMGLGKAFRDSLAQAGETLTTARDAAAEARALLRRGVDPMDEREKRREAAELAEAERKAQQARERWTLARWARDYHARVIEPSRTAKHAAQWLQSLENHVPAALWHAPIDSIEPPALLSALLDVKPHERARRHEGDSVPETVQRIRQRLDAVFEDAIFHKRASVNPAAAIKRKMREAAGKRQRGAFKALAYGEAPALMQALRAAPGVAARCLEFAVLTAARTSEALDAEWSEFELAAGTWTVPAAKMKGGEAHTVFLSPRALEVLRELEGLHTRWVFPSPMPRKEEGQAMSNMAMLKTLGRLGYRDRTTVHGLARATFSTWANETGAGRPDVIEACLAHEEGNRVRAAYNRAKFNDERRALLEAWAEFLARPAAPVVALESKRA
jgi:integrase